ncbi:YgiQ family radical SAM protein [uncultured Methanospirillum sp.]|uniref:YgiQ family radical SAM protein n=1 Tax=uncultured Methanospirillum sp. TaxID=262503 RepID=UPI0029C7C31A|nr:YgiQ family radical SAM protein [uncultured Methanospirillum sp.]
MREEQDTKHHPQPEYLPISLEELEKIGVDRPDIILISGDAYLDHPASATALLGRSLWDAGYTVGVIPQPDIKSDDSFTVFGQPNLFFSVSAGSMDSMVAHYTPARKRRHEDAFSPGGCLLRPDRATLVYTDLIHRIYPDSPIVIGGVEASLRRFAHYDYWSDRIRQSLLADAPADILVFGMGEQQLIRLAKDAASGKSIHDTHDIPGTCWKIAPKKWAEQREEMNWEILEIPSFTEVSNDPLLYAQSHIQVSDEQNPFQGKMVLQRHPKTIIIQNPPALPLSTERLDQIYGLPYKRKAHPSYQEPIPALESIRFSVTSHRGCFGNCSFCALAMHQGKIIQSRSHDSVIREIERIVRMKEFRGTISDIGGPSANMYDDWCERWDLQGACSERECTSCKSRRSGISRYLSLLMDALDVPGVKHVFIGSGLRYDLIPDEPGTMQQICTHVSGQLKVAPEHISQSVTDLMNKPGPHVFGSFRKRFEEAQKGKNPRQYIIPYLMSGHPGCTIQDMITLAEYLRDHRLYTEQVQDFTPTPMTTSTCMYATGLDPRTRKQIHIPKAEEKRIQRALLSWRDPAGYDLVREGLRQAGREDLIGSGPECLIGRRRQQREQASGEKKTGKKGKGIGRMSTGSRRPEDY